MGALRIMGNVGHFELKWKPLTEEEKAKFGDTEFVDEFGTLDSVLAEAERRFDEEIDELRGTAFAKDPETGEYNVQVTEFDPDQEIIIVPRIAGG